MSLSLTLSSSGFTLGEPQSADCIKGGEGSMRLLLIAVVAFLLLAACGGEEGQELSVEEIVTQTTEKTSALKGFHFIFSAENAPTAGEGLSLTFAEGDLVVPDRLRADIAGSLSGVSLTSELVIVGEEDFLKDPFRDEWRSFEIGTSPVAFFDPAKGVLAIIEGAKELEQAGSEEVGGADSYHLKGKVASRAITPILGNPPTERPVEVELWIGKEDFLLRRIRLRGPVLEGDPEDVVRTVELSKFDETVEIEPPEVSE